MKILIIHTSAGAGHTKAAEALYNGLQHRPGHEVYFVDALDHTSPFYKQFYQNTYTFLISKVPWAWGFFFWLTDRKVFRLPVKIIRRILNHFNARHLVVFLQREKFDYIFSTHFFPNEVATFLKRKGEITAKIISVVTDFDVHTMWLAEGIDCYTVACDQTKQKLITLAVPEDKIVVTGIPTHEKFSQPCDKSALKTQLELNKDLFTVLIATGSFGIGPIEKLAVMLKDYQTLIVCGRNRLLFSKLGQKNLKRAKVYGLVHNMHELMAVADCMVTKPGGLSICEALVKELPLIFFHPIPGQETHNVRVLKSYGVGVLTDRSLQVATQEVRKLSDSAEYLLSVKQNIQKLSRPHAVRDILGLIS